MKEQARGHNSKPMKIAQDSAALTEIDMMKAMADKVRVGEPFADVTPQKTPVVVLDCRGSTPADDAAISRLLRCDFDKLIIVGSDENLASRVIEGGREVQTVEQPWPGLLTPLAK